MLGHCREQNSCISWLLSAYAKQKSEHAQQADEDMYLIDACTVISSERTKITGPWVLQAAIEFQLRPRHGASG
jgi:hypothetical protein